MQKVIELSTKEIGDLARAAGWRLYDAAPDDCILEVYECPEHGVSNEEGDDYDHYQFIAMYQDYHDEGCFPLGEKTDRAQEGE